MLGVPVKIKKMPSGSAISCFHSSPFLPAIPSAKDFLYRMSRDSTCTEEEMREVQEVFRIAFKRLEPWLRERLSL